MAILKVGINGFGRIGRLVFRQLLQRADIEVVGINDMTDVETLAYLLKYDSVHGRFQGSVAVTPGGLVVNGKTIRATALADPTQLDWKAVGADIIIESTGKFTDGDKARSCWCSPCHHFGARHRKLRRDHCAGR
jgi:glyceraldehyde 3-phosphate dehydrogenase